MYYRCLQRELWLVARNSAEWAAIVSFFVMIVMMLPVMGVALLADAAWLLIFVVWIAALLSTMLAQACLWRDDYENKIFEQLVLADVSGSAVILVKILLHWICYLLPLGILGPILGLSMHLPLASTEVLCYSLVLGTLGLGLLGSLCGALTITLPRGGVLLALLALPLYVPILVLGCGATLLALQGFDYSGHLALLLAMDVIGILLVPKVIFAVIKASIA